MPGGFGNTNGAPRRDRESRRCWPAPPIHAAASSLFERDTDRGTYMINHVLPIEVVSQPEVIFFACGVSVNEEKRSEWKAEGRP